MRACAASSSINISSPRAHGDISCISKQVAQERNGAVVLSVWGSQAASSVVFNTVWYADPHISGGSWDPWQMKYADEKSATLSCFPGIPQKYRIV